MGNPQKLGNFVNALFQDASNNVGIGGSPSGSYKLEVTGTGRFSGALNTSQLIQTADSSTEMKIGRYNSSFPNAYIDAIGPSGDVGFQFRTQVGGAGGGTKMTITSAGNVGIGTSSPTYTLDVNGTIRSQANESSFGSAATAGTTMTIQSGSGNGAIRFKNAAGGDGTLLIQGTSNTIIYRFDTYSVGNAFQIANNGVITIGQIGSGTVTATSGVLSAVSDMNLKIEDGFIDNALEKVMNLKPRYYHWKEESGLPTDIRQLGFYAQEVNEALGEEVANTPKDEDGKWGIYDRGMIAMLTKAIQELSAQNQDLKSRLDKAGL